MAQEKKAMLVRSPDKSIIISHLLEGTWTTTPELIERPRIDTLSPHRCTKSPRCPSQSRSLPGVTPTYYAIAVQITAYLYGCVLYLAQLFLIHRWRSSFAPIAAPSLHTPRAAIQTVLTLTSNGPTRPVWLIEARPDM